MKKNWKERVLKGREGKPFAIYVPLENGTTDLAIVTREEYFERCKEEGLSAEEIEEGLARLSELGLISDLTVAAIDCAAEKRAELISGKKN